MTYLDKPWLKSYKLGPYDLEHSLAPYPEVPLPTVLDQAAGALPGRTAVLYEGRLLRYRDLKDQVDMLAAALARLGVRKGNRVCLFLPNCVEFVLCTWAVLRAGGVIVPTSILRTDEGLFHEAGSSGSRVIICREEDLERVLTVSERCGVERIVVTSTAGYDVEPVSTPLPAMASELRSLLEDSGARPPEVKISPRDDLCMLAFTGGATGVPKGVMLTHYNWHSVLLQTLPWFLKPLLPGVKGKASVLLGVPLFHVYGTFIHLSAINLGLRLILLPDPRDTEKMADMVREHRPFLFPGVPTQFMRLAELGLRRANTMLFSGSAPLPLEVAQMIKQKTGMPISEGYGMTETCTVTHVNVSAFSRITGFMAQDKHGIGVPCPDTECRLVHPDTGEDVRVGEPGEVVVRGPQVMAGYWPHPGSGLTPEGWLHSGDIGVMEDDGTFQIVDRIKDMVNVSGLKVYTTEVDEVLFRHPAVLMAAAFGVPDTRIPGSERVMAVVQLRESQRGQVSEEDIRAYCRERLPSYAVPRYVAFRDDMPLTVTEKVFKRALREAAIAHMREEGDYA